MTSRFKKVIENLDKEENLIIGDQIFLNETICDEYL